MGMTIAQGLILQGEAIGKTKGRAERSQEILLRQGRKKFGEPESAILEALQAIIDPEHFDRLSDAILDAATWPDLLKVV